MNIFPVLLPVNGEQRLARHRQHVNEVANGKFYEVIQAQWYLTHKVYGQQGYLELSAKLSDPNKVKRTELDGKTYIRIAEAHTQIAALIEGVTFPKNEKVKEYAKKIIDDVIDSLDPNTEASTQLENFILGIEKLASLPEAQLRSSSIFENIL